MNNRILSALGVILLVTLSSGAFAQPGQAAPNGAVRPAKMTPEARADMEISRIDAAAHVTDDQRTRLKQLFVGIETQRQQNRTAAAGDKEKFKEMNQGLNQQRKDGVKNILSPAQLVALKEARAANRANKQQNGEPQPDSDK